MCVQFSYIPLLLGLFSVFDVSQTQPVERIVNGDTIDILKAPWQIALLNNFALSCGGSILSNQIILTAAHCLIGVKPENLSVRAGSPIWSHGGQFRLVESFIMHELFDTTLSNHDMRFDFGVIRLTQPLTYGPGVHPIQLAQQEPKHGDIGYVSGWGSLSHDYHVQPAKLQGAEVSIYDQATCTTICAQYYMKVSEVNVCTWGNQKSVGRGDSGGPLVVNGHLAGVVSGVHANKTPAVFGNVALARDWIQNAINTIEASCANFWGIL